MAELFQRAGVPDGVVNVVTGTGAVAGEALLRHPGVDKIADVELDDPRPNEALVRIVASRTPTRKAWAPRKQQNPAASTCPNSAMTRSGPPPNPVRAEGSRGFTISIPTLALTSPSAPTSMLALATIAASR